tara:strand:+ start:688 stop:999 length:312 start_codon:yes stop_codon:yes gene_type:complete
MRTNALDSAAFRMGTEFNRLVKLYSQFFIDNSETPMSTALCLELQKQGHRTEMEKETTMKGLTECHEKWVKIYETKIAKEIKNIKPKIKIGEVIPKENVFNNP